MQVDERTGARQIGGIWPCREGNKAAAAMHGHRQRYTAREILVRRRLPARSAKLEVEQSMSDASDADAFKPAQ